MYTFLVRLAVTGSTKNEAINKHLFCECGQIATQFLLKNPLMKSCSIRCHLFITYLSILQ